MATKLSIWNNALNRVGVTQYIASVNENSTEAKVCRQVYEDVRDRVLAAFKWPFATRTADLQDIGTPPSNWEYRYRYPNDCITAYDINGFDIALGDPRVPFEIVADPAANERAIHCNENPASLTYVYRVINESMFPATFANCISWLLASEIAVPLQANIDAGIKAGQMYDRALEEAGNHAFREGRESSCPDSEFVRTRL